MKRPIEKTGEGADHWQLRVEKAWYVPRGAGLIDWFVAEILKNPPVIESEDPYWKGLNKNADGSGQDLQALVWKLQTEKILNGRAYLTWVFPGETAKPSDKSTMDARYSTLTAAEVDHWGCKPSGELLWIRKKSDIDEISPFGLKGDTLHTRTYITDKVTAVYEWRSTKDEKADENKVATLRNGTPTPHDFKHLPVYPVLGGKGCWIMNRIAQILIALFNREVSLTYALDQLAYPLLVFYLTGSDLKLVFDATVGAVKLKGGQSGEKGEYLQVSPASFDPLFKDVERLKNALYEVIQSLFVNAAATQTQNARQSAAAKKQDRDPLNTYLNSLACPVLDALEKSQADLKEYRQDPEDIAKQTGLDVFEADEKELEEKVKGTDAMPAASETAPETKPKPEDK